MEEDEGSGVNLGDAFIAFGDAVSMELTGAEVRAKRYPCGLDAAGYMVLELVVRRDGCRASDILRSIKLGSQALRAVRNDLLAKGVVVEAAERIVATARGRALVRSTHASVAAREKRTQEGLHAIRDGVQRIASAFDALDAA